MGAALIISRQLRRVVTKSYSSPGQILSWIHPDMHTTKEKYTKVIVVVTRLRRSDEAFLARKTEDSLKIRWHEIRNLSTLGYSLIKPFIHSTPGFL